MDWARIGDRVTGGSRGDAAANAKTLPKGKQCPQCWNKICKVHPLQDHGQAAARLTSVDTSSTLDRRSAAARGSSMVEDMLGARREGRCLGARRGSALAES